MILNDLLGNIKIINIDRKVYKWFFHFWGKFFITPIIYTFKMFIKLSKTKLSELVICIWNIFYQLNLNIWFIQHKQTTCQTNLKSMKKIEWFSNHISKRLDDSHACFIYLVFKSTIRRLKSTLSTSWVGLRSVPIWPKPSHKKYVRRKFYQT